MAIPVYTLVNTTGSPIVLDQLGLTIPGSGSIDATGPTDGSVTVTDVFNDAQLNGLVDAGTVTITIDAVALTSEQSKFAIQPQRSNLAQILHNDSATTNPGVGDDEDDGYSRGSLWVNTTSDRYYLCFDPAAGAAVWQIVASTGTAVDSHASRHLPGGADALSTAAAVSVGTANAEGNAASFARSNHTHQVTGFVIAGQAQGDVLYFNGTAWVRLAAGTAGQRLTTQGTGANPSWAGPKNYPNSATNPVSPAPAAGDTYFNTVLNMQMQYDASRSKWLSMDSATLQFGRNGSVGFAGTYLRAINGMITSATQGYDALYNGTVVGWSIRRTTSSGASYAVVASGTDIATLVFVSGNAVRETTTNADFAQGSVLAARLVSDAVSPENDPQVFIRMKWRL